MPAGGHRVLVVEDRDIVADKVSRTLARGGFRVAAQVPTVTAALNLLASPDFVPDAAVLDIDLRGAPAYPVAERLAALDVPFVLVTGYCRAAIAAPWRARPLVEKPFEAAALVSALKSVLAGVAPPPPPAHEPIATEGVRRAWDTIRHTRNIVTEARAIRETMGIQPPDR